MRRWRPAPVWAVAACALLGPSAAGRGEGAADRPAPATTGNDCGARALYLLLRLEGRPVAYDDLLRRLPDPPPDGYSMEELRAAARRLGVPLRGVRPARGRPFLPQRPALALVASPEGGHYLVIRRDGAAADRVQVWDPGHARFRIAARELPLLPGWTGLALTPPPPPAPRPLHPLAITAATAAAGILAARRRRRSRPPPPAAHNPPTNPHASHCPERPGPVQ